MSATDRIAGFNNGRGFLTAMYGRSISSDQAEALAFSYLVATLEFSADEEVTLATLRGLRSAFRTRHPRQGAKSGTKSGAGR